MRILIPVLISLSLFACQTTENQQTTSNNVKPVHETKETDRLYPFLMAKDLTNNPDTKHVLTTGFFKRYDPQTLAALKKETSLFDEPGKSLPHLKYLREIRDQFERNEVVEVFEKFKENPRFTNSQLRFFDKLLKRIINMTPEEETQTAACMAEYVWNDFTANQRTIFNKMALGNDLTSNEVQVLKITPKTNRYIGKIPKTVKCTLQPMGLYNELKCSNSDLI